MSKVCEETLNKKGRKEVKSVLMNVSCVRDNFICTVFPAGSLFYVQIYGRLLQ